MKIYKSLIIVIIIGLLILPHFASAQDSDCICCSYNSLKYRDTYKDIFPKDQIKEQGILEVVIYNKSKDSTYTEMKFKFDKEGSISTRIEYYNGKPILIYEFKRDLTGNIIQSSQSYIDSNEMKDNFFPTEIVDFIYDSKNRLIMSKKRDAKGNIVSDNQSQYTKNEYDDLNRITKKTIFSYFSNDQSYSMKTKYEYNDNSFSANFTTNYNGKRWLKGNKTFDNSWRVVNNRSTGIGNNPAFFEELFEYDNQGRIVKFQSISKGNYADECPEDGNYSDFYFYGSRGLLERITHSYNDVVCNLRFEYSK